jgi:tetratricopeptide (TPR) repeat protein
LRRTVAAVVLFLAAIPLAADPIPPSSRERAQKMERWRAELAEADREIEAGRFDRAETLYRSLIEQAGDDPDLLTTRAMDALADLYRGQERWSDAVPLYDRSVRAWELLLGPEQPRLATSLQNLAIVYLGLGRHDEALPLAARAATIFERSFGTESPDAVRARSVVRSASAESR